MRAVDAEGVYARVILIHSILFNRTVCGFDSGQFVGPETHISFDHKENIWRDARPRSSVSYEGFHTPTGGYAYCLL